MDLKSIQNEKPIAELLDFCLINLDKPSGLTSFQVCEKIRKILNAKKVGHAGTLDPMVTGVLPLLINRACKLSDCFMKKDKEYVGKMYLHSDIDESKLRDEMEKFIGKIMQKPPVRSRVKRVLRERIVNKFKIIKKDGRVVSFESDVQAGTYIRKLISDLGEKIGGAHMIELRRVRAGIFKIDESYTIEQVEKAFSKYKQNNTEELRKILIPAEIIQRIITRLDIKEEAASSLLNGKPLFKQDVFNKNIPNSDLFSVFCKNKFIGIYRIMNESSEQGILAKPQFVMN